MIAASAFRTYHTPLNSQPDFINALKAARQFAESVSQELGMQVGARSTVGKYACL
jgi:Niemann-Pick C1 protein